MANHEKNPIEDPNVDPEWTLLYYLRRKLRLCGTKLGCGEGGCGACTVMVSKYSRDERKIIHIPVNACLAPICSMHGAAVTTVEGIGSTKTRLHPVQERIAKAHGSQCGFCTPGIVMSMYTLLRNSSKPNFKQLEEAFQGNLCRCTGYRPILEGYKTFTEEWELIQNENKLLNNTGKCAMGDKCCKLKNGTNENCSDKGETLFDKSEFQPYDSSQEPIFPPELKLNDRFDKQYLIIKGQNVTWYRPTRLENLLDLKALFPEAKIVVGNTEVGVEVKFKNINYPVIIQPLQIPELNHISTHENGIRVGASVTLMELDAFLKDQIGKEPEHKTRIFKSLVNMLANFAGKQIRSVGALGGNIMTASPISDMIPILMANKVNLEVISQDNGIREVPLDNNFFSGYRKTVLKPSEILLAIEIPFTKENQYFYSHKQSRRRDDDIAIVNIAVNVTFKNKSDIIENIDVAFGGMSFKTITTPSINKVKGLRWNLEMVHVAYSALIDDLPLQDNAPGGMVYYRKSLSLSLFFKAYLAISRDLEKSVPAVKLQKADLSGSEKLKTRLLQSAQCFTIVPDTQEKYDQVHRPLVHVSAFKQATGEAVYCDDIPTFENELHMAFVQSTKAYANILSIDPTETLKINGVRIFSGKDLPGEKNNIGRIAKDEKIFNSDLVTSYGQIIAAVVADDPLLARKAAKLVKVQYEELSPVIVTIEDAIKENSFFESAPPSIVFGNIDNALSEAPCVIEGEYRLSGQEHFYLETQCAVVAPGKEDDEMTVCTNNQNPTEVGSVIAKVLGIQQNKITSQVKRIGGAFGGKEWSTMLIAVPAAVIASKLNRPVRVMLDRDEDMSLTGGRHPFLFKYRVGFNEEGKIMGLDIVAYSNGGYSLDVSQMVMAKCMSHCTNSYYFPAVRFAGHLCKTNLPSNTAFRGFGAPQAMFLAESMLEDVAQYLKKDVAQLRYLNMYRQGDVTVFRQILTECTLTQCWDECIASSDYERRKITVDEFNRNNTYKKRGISVVPTMYGSGFGGNPHALFLNQAGALVLVYTDGSVLLSHGGVEMGQGLLTKMIQVASRALELPVEKIHTAVTSSDKVPNTSPTAASSGSDLNGMAVLDACNKIKNRLKPYKDANPNGTWEEWVRRAYMDRISLSATGFYKVPDLGYDENTGSNNIVHYFTYGVACSEVEIDTLTGDHQVLRTDIVMDLGESLNPAIDIGQIEGAFMQGYGLFILEEMMYSPNGTILTKGPGTYKIPSFTNIPSVFNVSLLKGASNPKAVYSSKAVGEPPLFLASSVFFAIRNAIEAARKQQGIYKKFRLDSPATSERIRLACEDDITSRIEDRNVDPAWTLLYYLRRKLRLCGTKLGCGEGGCGACTVMISKYDRVEEEMMYPLRMQR